MEVSVQELAHKLYELSRFAPDRFRCDAYAKASKSIADHLTEDDLKSKDNFKYLPGIGDAINKKIIEYRNTGEITKLNKAKGLI